jgi:cobalamin biosynthesis Mg chelatase CobN
MRSSSIIVAASAFAGFAAAQNSTFNTPIPCCTVDPNSVDQDDRQSWCQANQNTCVELCGGRGQLASNGNQCDSSTLKFSCKCRNGTDVSSSMSQYQQTVPGQMCLVWYSNCIAASGSDATAQFECEQARDSLCGNKTVADATEAGNSGSSSGSSSASPSATNSDSPSSTGASESGSAASSTSTPGAASNLAFYGTSALAGGLFALFGMAL